MIRVPIRDDFTEEEGGGCRPLKTQKLDDKAIIAEPKPSSTYARYRDPEPETDEYIRQYLLFHYQFYKTQGFGIEWDKFDYSFELCQLFDVAPPNEERIEWIKEVTLPAIAKHNQDNGTNLVFVEHVSASFRFTAYMQHWLTFWAKDMSSPCPDSKLYQVLTSEYCGSFENLIFRVKPTDEEMMAATVHVKPPFPIKNYEIGKPPIVFRLANPGEDPVPGTPFVFNRYGSEDDIGSTEDYQ